MCSSDARLHEINFYERMLGSVWRVPTTAKRTLCDAGNGSPDTSTTCVCCQGNRWSMDMLLT